MSKLDIIGDEGSHDALRRELAAATPCKVLDAPAGTGVLAKFLLDLGWDVSCADIDPGNFELEGIECKAANLNGELPFEDESFDAVVCANALHRVWNVRGAVRELARVVKPGGLVYVNVNNYSGIDRRVRFLLYGSVDNAVNRSGVRQTISDPEAQVRFNLFYPQLAIQLEDAGFEIVKRRASATRMSHVVLMPLAWVIWLVSWLIPSGSRRRSHVGGANGRGLLPGGRYVLIVARKNG